jgi:hypothetical protein
MNFKTKKQSDQEFREKLRSVPFVPVLWRPKTVKYDDTEVRMSGSAGLGFMTDLFSDDPLFDTFRKCLPKRRSRASYDSEVFAMTTILSIIEGHDCIEDITAFERDPFVLKKLGGEIPSTYAMGDYYRDFSQENRDHLNDFLRVFARRARKQVAPDEAPVIDIDSTSHVQRGLKMEGVELGYKGKWCLDSLAAWDELGFCHGMELRGGRTFSSQGAPELIRKVFSHLKHGNSTGEDQVKAGAITTWTPWEYSKEKLDKTAEQKIKLPVVALGSMVYKPGGVRTYDSTLLLH